MAFEKISDYTEKLRKMILDARHVSNTHEFRDVRMMARHEETTLFKALVLYHDTVLSTAKFKSQKQGCRGVLEELNPSFCKGYFK